MHRQPHSIPHRNTSVRIFDIPKKSADALSTAQNYSGFWVRMMLQRWPREDVIHGVIETLRNVVQADESEEDAKAFDDFLEHYLKYGLPEA